MTDIADRLLEKVRLTDNGCWKYIGGIGSSGYGNIWCEGTTKGAHIVSYEIHKGPVPKGQWVCHDCDNRWCVNPEHLFLGSAQDNIDDMVTKGRDGFKGTRNGRCLLSEEQVIEIRALLLENQLSQQSIADRYNVSRSTISAISTSRNWGKL